MDQLDGNQHVTPMLSGNIHAGNSIIVIICSVQDNTARIIVGLLFFHMCDASCVLDIGSFVSRLPH